MRLIKLEIFKQGSLFREIKFNKAVNIVTNIGDHGNRIGKSTVLRIINYCLGSSGESILKDPESKSFDPKIQALLGKEELSFKLTVNNGVTVVLERWFKESKGKYYRRGLIDGNPYHSQKNYKAAIERLFGHKVAKPTFNTIKNRVFRLDKGTSGNIYNFNDVNTRKADYILIYSYLFGFSGHKHLEEQYQLQAQLEDLDRSEAHILDGKDFSYYLEQKNQIELDIDALVRNRNTFDSVAMHKEELEKLHKIRSKVAAISAELSELEIKKYYSQKTIDSFNSKIKNIDVDYLKSIYDEVSSNLGDLSRTFEDAVDFHNSIFKKKRDYVASKQLLIDNDFREKSKRLEILLENEKHIISYILNETPGDQFYLVEKKLSDQYQDLGRVKFVIDKFRNIQIDKDNTNSKIIKVKAAVEVQANNLKENLAVFNGYLKNYSGSIFPKFQLSMTYDIDRSGSLTFSVVNQEKALGDGEPRAASMAVDISMVQYAKDVGLKIPHFTLQDYIDAIDETKLKSIVEICNRDGIQIVLSGLSHVLINSIGEEAILENKCLLLSQEDKLFGV